MKRGNWEKAQQVEEKLQEIESNLKYLKEEKTKALTHKIMRPTLTVNFAYNNNIEKQFYCSVETYVKTLDMLIDDWELQYKAKLIELEKL